MAEVLLKELTNQDIDWMLAIGKREEIAAGTTLIRQGQPIPALYILLDGALSISISQPDDNPIGRAFAALEGGELSGREIARLSNGDMVGELLFLDSRPASTTVKVLRDCLVLTIPRPQLMAKLQSDISFAAHFYRSVAILLANRLEQMVQELSNSTSALCHPQLREILFVFAELHDSDIGWMISVGEAIGVPLGEILIHSNRPVECLYILLDGKMSASMSGGSTNSLTRAFSLLEDLMVPGAIAESPEQEFARFSRGDIMGETPFVEVNPPAITVKAITDSIVLAIPRWQLSAKLLQDEGFASRFYRVLAILFADKQQGLISRLGYGRLTYSSGQSLDDSQIYEAELDSNFLSQVTLAGTRFDWMLKQLRAS
jgi:bacteriocin-type transport-associated protein